MTPPANRVSSARAAFTLVELLIVIVVLLIIATLALPSAESTMTTRLIGAARMFAADIEFARADSIAHPDDPRVLKLDPANHRYWIAAASDVNTPIDDPASQGVFLVTMGSGRAAGLAGVTISGYSLGGDEEVHFDMFGGCDQTSAGSITLAYAGRTITVAIAPATGEVSIQ